MNFSILDWIIRNQIKNEKGDLLNFSDRPFLLDILTDWSKEIVVKKCSQVGGSVVFNLKTLFAIMKFRFNFIYTFPTDSDVKEFVSSKTNKLIQQNPQVFGGMPTDNIERKEINDRFIFFKGTVSKTAMIMTTADILVHDEISRSDQGVVNAMRSRTKASSFQGRWLFSNPTTEKDALDEAWKKSDQKEWLITCDCGFQQQLIWPDNIDIEKKIFKCIKCNKEITNDHKRRGKWVAQNPGSLISGYHISHLIAPWVTAAEIIEESQGDQEYFYNFILGEPYNPGDLSVGRHTILDCWTPKDLTTGKYFLGVDVGNMKHYALGSEKGVIKVGRFTKWEELDDMLKFYKPNTVIDAMPDNTMSKYYVEHYDNVMMSFFQENKANPMTLVWWGEGDKRGIVYSNRNRILDQMIDDIVNAKILFGVEPNNDFRDFVKHFETLRRVKVTDTRGIESYEWVSTTGVDHYCFALLYFYLAKLGYGNGVFMSGNKQEPEAIVATSDGFRANLQEIIEEKLDNDYY